MLHDLITICVVDEAAVHAATHFLSSRAEKKRNIVSDRCSFIQAEGLRLVINTFGKKSAVCRCSFVALQRIGSTIESEGLKRTTGCITCPEVRLKPTETDCLVLRRGVKSLAHTLVSSCMMFETP